MDNADNVEQHMYLAYCEVVFKQGRSVNKVGFNTMLRLNEQKIRRADLARAQQATQMRFFQEVWGGKPPADLEVTDVTFISNMYLGFMSMKDFDQDMDMLRSKAAEAAKEIANAKSG